MTSNSSDRLDTIESNIAETLDILMTAAQLATNNAAAIDHLTAQVQSNTQSIDRLTARIDRLAISQENTQATVDQLATLMVQFAQNAEIDRAEIRRIWEYLLSQSGNGRV